MLNFTTAQIGILGSAHFVGFLIGCWWVPRLMADVGHSPAFAALIAAGAIGISAHMLVINPFAWALMRVASGICTLSCYTIIEAWLRAKVTNKPRGRAMGPDRVVDICGSLGAQPMIAVLEPASYVSYNLLAVLCCADLFPLTLAAAEPPRFRPRLVIQKFVPAAALVIESGVSGALSGAAAIFGFASMPIYSVSKTHAHGVAASSERVELSAALNFLYAWGRFRALFFAFGD